MMKTWEYKLKCVGNCFFFWKIVLFFIYFSFNFKQTLTQILHQINVKNGNPVYDAGIRTHDLQIASLEQG